MGWQLTVQTGAAGGMWTFDRYSRWMEQKQDWVRPQRGAPTLQPSEPTPPSDQGPLRPRAIVTSAAPTSNLPSTASPASVIEISEEEADLNKLARKIAQDPKKSNG